MKLKVNFRVPPCAVPLLSQTLTIMRLTIVLLIAACLQVRAESYAQKISLSEKNASLEKIFKAIQKQTEFRFFYKDELLKKTGKVDINVKDVSVEEVLDLCLRNLPLTYSIVEKTIIVKEKAAPVPPPDAVPEPYAEISGTVKDNEGKALAGASVRNKRTGKGTATDADGKFSLEARVNDELEITSIGYQTQLVKVGSLQQVISVSLNVEVSQLENTIVIAYGNQKRKRLRVR